MRGQVSFLPAPTTTFSFDTSRLICPSQQQSRQISPRLQRYSTSSFTFLPARECPQDFSCDKPSAKVSGETATTHGESRRPSADDRRDRFSYASCGATAALRLSRPFIPPSDRRRSHGGIQPERPEGRELETLRLPGLSADRYHNKGKKRQRAAKLHRFTLPNEEMGTTSSAAGAAQPFIQSGSTAAMERHEIAAIVQPLPD
jgi:hypothetical protein